MDSADKQWCLEKAVEIIKEKARGGDKFSAPDELERIYNKLKELLTEVSN